MLGIHLSKVGKDGINLSSRSRDECFYWQGNSTLSNSNKDFLCKRGDK